MSAEYLLGSGDLAREIIAGFFWADTLNGVFDDQSQEGIAEYKLPYLGPVDAATEREGAFYLAVGSPQTRRKFHDQLSANAGALWPVMLHSTAVLYEPASITMEPGCRVSAACVLTRNIHLERGVFINLNVTIGHDCADRCLLVPYAQSEHLGQGADRKRGVHRFRSHAVAGHPN